MVIKKTHYNCINNLCDNNGINTKVGKYQEQCHCDHICYQCDGCMDHRKFRLADTLEHTVGNIGITIKDNGNPSKDQKLSAHTISSREYQSCDRT